MKPFKNILMLPHPFPTVLIGHMKLCLYLTFLSLLLLSGCGGSSGGGGGEGATSSSKKAKACTTPLSNGKGELPWNTKTKKYSTICKVVSCNAGYVKNTGENSCDIPETGKYADNGVEKDCSPITGDSDGFNAFASNTGAVSAADGCGFSCNAGFVKSGRTCNIPDPGKYADNAGGEQSCSPITGDIGGFDDFAVNTGAVSTAADCDFSCNTGFVKSGRACNIPDPGKYADNAGGEQSCSPITGDIGGFDDFAVNTGAVSTAAGCDFSCNAGFVKSGRTCNIPDPGKYADNAGGEQSCSPITGDIGGFDDFAVNTGAVSTAADCDFSCNTGFVKSGRACNIPHQGKYADNGVEKDCSPITGDSGGVTAFAVNTGAVSSATGCGFSCNAGFVKDSSGRACNYPSLGNYVNAAGIEASCDSNPITIEGAAVATWIAGAAATAATCPFSCTAGYAVDSSGRECSFPSLGHYVNNQGTESLCTDISGITGFGSWLEGAATADDACPFSCASGYTMLGRICRRPEMLALGTETSHILFSNGEVEAWGKVSTSPWRSHIKENLGGNTPQALVSGGHHQCIILKNSTLNHGRLMCWGANDEEQLGVGDTNPRTTPTAVGHTILGDTGGGVPNTVKSVAAGDKYTCALLNDDTVVCWGNNSNGQIGGGSGANNTISGTVGGPLGSGNADRIAAGMKHTCAVLSDKSVQCWGHNRYSQTGGGTPSLGAGKTATEIATGGVISCAILNDASVKCWGHSGSFPNLGVGKTATQIAAGRSHACAILNDKTVSCWGSWEIDYSQIGGGTAASDRVLRGTLGDPLGGQTAIQIAAGYKHTCAVMELDNSVKCWGKNIDNNNSGFYGQIIGEVAMTGGSDGTGTSTGETATLTTASTPTATSLDSDANGQICALTLSRVLVRDYMITGVLRYNTGSGTDISTAIDNLIATIGSPVSIGGTDVTLSRKGSDKIEATVNNAALDGITLAIHHDNDGGGCLNPVRTDIPLSGASGGAIATGLWVISEDYFGSGDTTINLDSVHIDLGTSNLTKEKIADKIVADVEVTSRIWAGKQHKDLPYTVTKLDGSSNANDDCPTNDFCVVFDRVFKGTEGNNGIPFGDRDYEH